MTDIPAPATAGARPAKKALGASVRRVLGLVHLWIGVIFCIPFVLLGVSGSLLMVGRELPNRFVADSAASSYKPMAEIIQAAQAAAPEGRVVVSYDAPLSAGEPAVLRLGAPPRSNQQAGEGGQRGPQGGGPGGGGPGAQTRVLVDPVSLDAKLDQVQPPRIIRADGSLDFMRLMHDMHGAMLLAMPGGRQFVGWLGVLMCGLGLSGIIMWWPKPGQWRAAFKVRFGQSALRVNRELHGAAGIWAWVVFLIVSFSGVYIVFPQPINSAVDAGPQIRDLRNQQPFNVTPVADAAPIDADAAAALARDAVPGGIVRAVALPSNPTQPYRVTLSRIGDFNGKPRPLVIVDPWQSKVMEVRDPDTYSSIDKFLAFQRQMHAGNALGWWWWIPVFFTGFLPPLFVATGISMWLIKRRNKKRVAAQV